MTPNHPHHVLLVVALPQPVETEDGSALLEAMPLLESVQVYGPDTAATCEAAAAKINRETHTFAVREITTLDVDTRSELVKQLDEQDTARRKAAEELGGFS